MTDIDAFLAAISGNESGGNYEAYNASTGARGKYQFIQSTYDMYADDPSDWSPEMQEQAAHKMAAEYISKYGYRNAAIAWLGGEGAIGHEDWSDGNMTTGEYADKAMATMQAYLGGDFIDSAVTPVGPWGTTHGYQMPNVPEPKKVMSFWEEFYNKFTNQFVDQGSVSVVRSAWANLSNMDSFAELATSDYRPSKEDIELVQKGLEGDTVAQQYVLSMAHNRKTLLELLAMKQEDRARAQAVDNMDYGLSSIGSILGSIADPTLLLAFIPGANVSTIANVASKVGKLRALMVAGSRVINGSKAASIAARALTTSVAAGADRFAAERWGGFKPDYASAMTFGALVGAIGGAMRNTGGAVAEAINNSKKNIEDEAVRIAAGVPTKMEAKVNLQDELNREMLEDFAQEGTDIQLHYKPPVKKAETPTTDVAVEGSDIPRDVLKTVVGEEPDAKTKAANEATDVSVERKTIPTNGSGKDINPEDNIERATKNLYTLIPEGSFPDKLIKSGCLFIMSSARAKKWATRYGVNLDPDAKAFSIPKMGISIILRDKVNEKNIFGVVAHEVGVHLALKKVLGQKAYDSLLDLARRRMEKSNDSKWIAATRKATNAEEALAYYVEQINWNKPPKNLRFVTQALKEFVSPRAAEDAQVEKAIRQALEGYTKIYSAKDTARILMRASKGTRSPKWKAAIEATKNKDIAATIAYWLKHDPETGSILYKEIQRQAQTAAGKRLTKKEIVQWAIEHFTPKSSPLVYVAQRMNIKANDPLMTIKAFGEDDVIPRSTIATDTGDNSMYNLGEMLTRNVTTTLENEKPVQTLPDGSHIIDNVTYSPKNTNGTGMELLADDIGEIHYSKGDVKETVFDAVSDKGQGSKVRQGKFGKLGLWMEHGLFFGNIFGIMRNSHSRKMQMASHIMFTDPRMEESFVDFLPTESIKQLLMYRWQSQYISFLDKRQKYINDTYGIFNFVRRNNLIHQVNEQVIDCYNARARGDAIKVKEFPAGIQEMASDLETMTDDIMKQMQKSSENLGGRKGLGSLLKKEDMMDANKEFYRITDETKMMNWLSRNYSNLDDAMEDLTEYARRFMDREAETKYFIESKKREFEKGPKKDKNGERIEWKEPTQEEIEKHLEEAAIGWAKGRIDKNMSRLNFDPKSSNLKNPYTAFSDTLKHRLPVDTTGEMKLKNGVSFSFDKDLRSYDLDGFLPQIMNRISGEISLRATIGDAKAQKEFFDSIAQELAKNGGVINGERELAAMQMGLNKILGIGSYNHSEQRIMDGISNMIRSWSYANVGGNMTWAQLGELGGSIAYGGFKVLMNNLPVFGNLAKNMRLGADGAEIVDNVTRKMFAEDIATRGWRRSDSTESKVFTQLLDKVSEENPVASRTGRTFDAMNRNIKRAALMTSSVNFMPKLTNAMVKSMRQAAIEDCLQWASGKNMKGLLRNPFSKGKCAAAGLHTQKDIENVQKAIKKYLVDEKGNIDHWLDEDPMTFSKFKRLVDNESMRGIQQQSIGNMTPFKENHKIFFQFKDFTLKAMNQQFMRALSSRERDDAMAALYSYATNTASYYGMTVAKAYMYYPGDENEQKRQEYLERNANPMKVALAGFFRMSMTAPMSFVSDGWEAATGQSMYRTTVDNTRNIRDSSDSWDKRVADFANQMPALGSLGRLYNATQSGKKFANGEGTTKDIDAIIGSLPLGQYLLMGRVAAGFKETSKLPDKKSTNTKKTTGQKKTQSVKTQNINDRLKAKKANKKSENIVSKLK